MCKGTKYLGKPRHRDKREELKGDDMMTVFSQDELEALASAAEEMAEMVESGRRWQNEPPETLRALKTARDKLMAECDAKETP